MAAKDDQILRTAKEVVVKYIEIGRISPQSFAESFKDIYTAIDEAVRTTDAESSVAAPAAPVETEKQTS